MEESELCIGHSSVECPVGKVQKDSLLYIERSSMEEVLEDKGKSLSCPKC